MNPSKTVVAKPGEVAFGTFGSSKNASGEYSAIIRQMTQAMGGLADDETNTSGLRPGTGALASDKVADDIRTEAVGDDARGLALALQEIVNLVTELNYGPDVIPPLCHLDTDDLEDLQRRQKSALALAERMPVSKRWVLRLHRAVEPTGKDDVLHTPQAQTQAPPSDSADPQTPAQDAP